MSRADIVMPMFGQAMEFGLLAEWLAADGEAVQAGQPIASIESDKATYEIEAPLAGVLRHRAKVGAEVPVGELLGVIAEAAEARPVPETEVPAPSPVLRKLAEAKAPLQAARVLASPKAREAARAAKVDLTQVTTQRADGVIVAADVERHGARAPVLNPLRRAAARRLSQSWAQAPHFTQMIEADATALAAAQAAIRAGRVACSLNDVLIRVAALTLAEFPDINARYEDERLVPMPDIAVGLAVATEAGLAVPVVRNAAGRTLEEVAAETRRLIEDGRHGRIAAADMGQASLTLSNLGRYGVAFGTPVLNLGEPLLLFVGAIEEKAVGVAGEIVLQPRTMLSLCYDHRVVDGLRAAQFSQRFKQRLESLDDVLPREAAEVQARPGVGFVEGGVRLQLGEADLRLAAKDARILSIAAALAAVTAELPRDGPTARKLKGVEIRIEAGVSATLLCESEAQAALVRRAVQAASIASYSTAVLHVAVKAARA